MDVLLDGLAKGEREVVLAEQHGMTTAQHERYYALVGAITVQSHSFTEDAVPADKAAAKAIAVAALATKPRTCYTIGRDAAIIVKLARLAPRPYP